MGGAKFERVAIIGVGLIGGSLSLEARGAGLFGHVTGCGRTIPNLEVAKKAGIIDEYTNDPVEAVEDADLVILATPVTSIVGLAKTIAPALKKSAKKGVIVTDVGSVKGEMVTELEEALGTNARLVAGHPVAGSEKFGAAAAVKGLFKGRRCILTPTDKTDKDALKLITGLWQTAGMEVIEMDPFTHDRIMAAISHLPHLVAYALVETVLKLKESEPGVMDFAAGGFHDFTRIAGSSPEMWRDILMTNRRAVLAAMDALDENLCHLRDLLSVGDAPGIEKFLASAKRRRDKIGRAHV